jgi:hypothetical protein
MGINERQGKLTSKNFPERVKSLILVGWIEFSYPNG